jgi:Icc-related predicted phosphoesterase
MKRVAWTTDIHLEMVPRPIFQQFLEALRNSRADMYVISGDISEAPNLDTYLRMLEGYLEKPIYFVLGNHDYYRGSIQVVRERIQRLHDDSTRLNWLPKAGLVELTPQVAMFGHGAWSDCRYGNYDASPIMLNDYVLIQELAPLDKQQRLEKLHELGDEAAAYVRATLPQALDKYPEVIFITHSPPFREACYHEGKMAQEDDLYLPHFSCQAVGDVLLEIMSQYPERKLTVICGHTHGAAEVQMLDNLQVIVGGAEYGQPEIVRIFDFK